MTMLEKAARAQRRQLLSPYGEPREPWEDLSEGTREAYRQSARAVLRAIREPDERVLLAMAIILMGERTASITDARAAAGVIWRAGIDAMMEDRHD